MLLVKSLKRKAEHKCYTNWKAIWEASNQNKVKQIKCEVEKRSSEAQLAK